MMSLHGPSPIHTTGGEGSGRLLGEKVQMPTILVEHTASAIPLLAIKFLDSEVQERDKGWIQVDLIIYKIPMQTLYQFQVHITEDLSQRAHATKMDHEVLASEHVEIQKSHLEIKKKNEKVEKVENNLYTNVQIFYQIFARKGLDVPIEEKIKKVDDTIYQIQVQVEEMQLKIKSNTHTKKRERRQKVNEASNELQLLSAVKLDFQVLNRITLDVYEQLLIVLEIQKINQEVQEVDVRSAQFRA